VIVEPTDLPAQRVLDQVRARWDDSAVRVEHAPVGVRAFHWVVADAAAPRWFATADILATSSDRLQRVRAYEVAAHLGEKLDFVVAPVHDRMGQVAVDLSPGYLLSVSRFEPGRAGPGFYADDDERVAVARLLGRLHASARPPGMRTWQPSIGWRSDAQRDDLVRVVQRDSWTAGPLSEQAGHRLNEARAAMRAALTRFDLLVAAVRGAADRWVLTHGEPHTGNVLQCPSGPRLVDWHTLALAPRERDLRHLMLGATSSGPLRAYVDAGGVPGPLSPDTLELFDLEWRLSEVAAFAVRLARPHPGSEDDLRCLADLERELGELRRRLGQL